MPCVEAEPNAQGIKHYMLRLEELRRTPARAAARVAAQAGRRSGRGRTAAAEVFFDLNDSPFAGTRVFLAVLPKLDTIHGAAVPAFAEMSVRLISAETLDLSDEELLYAVAPIAPDT